MVSDPERARIGIPRPRIGPRVARDKSIHAAAGQRFCNNRVENADVAGGVARSKGGDGDARPDGPAHRDVIDDDVPSIIPHPEAMRFIRQVSDADSNVLHDHVVCIDDDARAADHDSWRWRRLPGNRNVRMPDDEWPLHEPNRAADLEENESRACGRLDTVAQCARLRPLDRVAEARDSAYLSAPPTWRVDAIALVVRPIPAVVDRPSCREGIG